MKKIILLLTIFLVGMSCDQVPMEKPIYVVRNIEELNNIWIYGEGICRYIVDTGKNYSYYSNKIELVDSIGKFAIGDTIVFYIRKQE